MDFSFNSTANSSQSSSKPRLAGNNIYNVQFDGCEILDIKGVKNPNELYRVLKLKFSNSDGSFEHTVFEPKDKDFARGETQFTDKTGKESTIPQPSGVENTMLLFKHAIDSINPELAKQIDNGEKSLGAKDWHSLRNLVFDILDPKKGATCQIKLLINNKGEASFPGFFSGITKEGKAYIRNNFIGNKLAFSTYEVSRIKNAANAKPREVTPFVPITNFEDLPEDIPSDINLNFDMPKL